MGSPYTDLGRVAADMKIDVPFVSSLIVDLRAIKPDDSETALLMIMCEAHDAAP